ncbi:hypothetical protein DSM104299_01552 [Baekduia alba]|uniref:hypothetical protein n=1 Tax=Baekduia alba TaxID=2997333 RepID=UPI00233F9B16|nr:hypothetical protein [Baekduia alba]WCB92852.1 hypothetical protein DSM104299_01552 [Baekduia alba]
MEDAQPDAEEEIDLVASVGPLDAVVETLRDVLHRSGALRVAVVVDMPDGPAALVDVGRLAPVEVRIADRTMHLPHAIELEAESLGGAIELRQLPPFEVEPESGQVTGTLGGLDMLADAMRQLAELLGGRSVAIAVYQTVTPSVDLTVTARHGEPVLITLGEQEWELPER